MKTTKESMTEIKRLLTEYEKEVYLAEENGLLEQNTVKTYLLHSRNFTRWCQGEFTPGGRNI